MRVISGKYKGRFLDGHKIAGTRPTMDRVKESMFAMLQNDIPESCCLDLFSGSGNLGIEAISNGAKKVYFVDFNQICIQTIEKNLRTLQITEEAVVLKKDYLEALRYFKERNIEFQVIFLDPPYRLDIYKECINFILDNNLLNKKGLFILETNSQLQLNDIENKFSDIRYYSYGYSKIYILRT